MTDLETKSEEPLEAQTAVAPATETDQVQEAPQEQPNVTSKKRRNSQEYNWAEANKVVQQLQRENREMQSQLSKMQKPEQVEDELDRLAPDELMTKAQAEKLAERKARQIAEQVIRQREAATVDERLGIKFSDFTDVVNDESVALLKEQEPELFHSITTNPDPYGQGVAAYKLLKKMGYQTEKDIPEKAQAVKNSQKPVSVNAVTKTSAIGNAHLFENGLTKELKSQLWKEMTQAARMA